MNKLLIFLSKNNSKFANFLILLLFKQGVISTQTISICIYCGNNFSKSSTLTFWIVVRPLDTEPGALISTYKNPFDPTHTAIIFLMRSKAIFAWFLTGSDSSTGVFQYGGAATIFYREDFPESFEAKKTNCEYFGGKIPSSKSWFSPILHILKVISGICGCPKVVPWDTIPWDSWDWDKNPWDSPGILSFRTKVPGTKIVGTGSLVLCPFLYMNQ